MPSERSDLDPTPREFADGEENGVLSDAASIDTTRIGLLSGSTAQVSVSVPSSDEDDDDLIDDDIVADEVEIVSDEDVVVEDDEDDQDDDDQWRPEAIESGDAGDDPDDADEDAESENPESDERAERDDREPDDTESAHVEPEEDVEPIEAVIDDEDDASWEDDASVVDDAAEELPEDEFEVVDARDVSEDVEPGDEVVAELADDDLPEQSVSANATADAATAEAAVVVDADEDSTGEDAVADAPSEDAGATASTPHSRREAHQTGPIARAHEVERVQPPRPSVTLTSKRLGEFHADRESADLLTADRLLDHGKVSRPEPEGGWQHFVYSISGGLINLGDSKRARARKELDRQIAAPLSGGARFVPVLSRKGGVGKTTVTALLGMALADARDDRVIAVDANPDRGTLAERLERPSGKTVRDLVRTHDEVTGYNDISTIVARDETRLDVLASDADPRVSEAFSDRDYEDVAEIAAHYYSIVLTDTGTGIVHSVMGATLQLADQLVIVSGLSVDEARLASETLTWLETNGFDRQVRNAVVVLNNARPGAPLVRQEELEAHFGTRVRAVVRIPYDPHIATGSAILFRDLQPATRAAARELAVAVVEGLRSVAVAA